MKELMSLKELILISQINQKECMICHYWYFKDIGDKYEPLVCNQCHDLSMMVYDLNDFIILNIKGNYYRCDLFNMSRTDPIKLLNNFCLDNIGVL